VDQQKADQNGLAEAELHGQPGEQADDEGAKKLHTAREENFGEVLQEAGQPDFDADGEHQKSDANVRHQRNAGNVVDQFQTERPDQNAGDEKADDGRNLNFIKYIDDRNGEA